MPTLSKQTIAIVKATVPVLEIHGLKIVQTMYAHLFRDPAIRGLFNQSHHGETGSQSKALTAAILAYGQNIESLDALQAAVERIAQKHVGLQILPEHYPAVADALLAAIKEVLGEAATQEVLGAWGEAYWFLAEILMAREHTLYSERSRAEGGWSGWREFRVCEKARESDIITSFVLEPADGGPVLWHKPGQYLTFSLDLPGQHPLKRNYSISSGPNGRTYRITVKREPDGAASNWLHNEVDVGTTLKVAAPSGEFFIGKQVQRPVVLLSGGVGLTPMVSMLESLIASGAAVPIHFVHGAFNGATHAMAKQIRALADGQSNVRVTTFYLRPSPADRLGMDYDAAGLITPEWLKANAPLADADFFICGPKSFLRTFVMGLQEAGVAPARIHYEFFGPTDELLAA